jgi:DNA-binding NarL/FixJ family response regulator
MANLTAIRVMIVDDHPVVRAGLASMLSTQPGIVVVGSASSGLEALTLLEKIAPDVILMDLRMPGMSGLEMLPKGRAQRPDVPVIMITAYGDAETRRKAIERGATGLLTKPLDFALLRHEIDTRLEQAA